MKWVKFGVSRHFGRAPWIFLIMVILWLKLVIFGVSGHYLEKCGSKCRGQGGGIFLTLCVKCCLVYYASTFGHQRRYVFEYRLQHLVSWINYLFQCLWYIFLHPTISPVTHLGDKPLPEPMLHICGTRGRWDKPALVQIMTGCQTGDKPFLP